MPTKRNGNKLILVAGATGQQGGATLRRLREQGYSVRALTRDPDSPQARTLTGPGVEVARGDMQDAASLTPAMDGAYGVFSVQNSRQAGFEDEIRQGINLAEAARRTGVTHFVYSSVASADQQTGLPHFDSKFRIEEHIRSSGLHFTIVRPVFFMENWLLMRQTIEAGTLSLPLKPETRVQMIAVNDIGGVAAMAFEHPGKWQNRVFELAGDELSMAEVAAVFARIAGHDVRYVQGSWEEFEKQAGKEISDMYRWFENVGYHVDIGQVRQEYHGLTSFEQWAHSAWHSATRTAR